VQPLDADLADLVATLAPDFALLHKQHPELLRVVAHLALHTLILSHALRQAEVVDADTYAEATRDAKEAFANLWLRMGDTVGQA
jgi:hypothetical protein